MKDIIVKYYKKLYIESSTISGEGLFAGEEIAKGEKILSFGGTLALQSERYSGLYLPSTFVGISETIMLCETANSEKDYSDYINHSCNPNAGMLDCLTIMAITDIAKDEEILCDYSFWEADENWVLGVACKCNNKNCRNRITGKDWENVRKDDINFQYYSPFLKRRILKNAKRA